MRESTFPYRNRQNKGNMIKSIIFIFLVVVVAALLGMYLSRPRDTTVKNEVAAEKNVPSPTEKPQIEKSAVKIQVLNGTGTPGQAGIAVKALEGAGYASDNIKTSNADTYDNPVTTVTVRAGFEGIGNDMQAVLKPVFENATVSTSKLSDNGDFDIVVVTGGKIFETATSVPSPTSSETPTPMPSPTP